MIVRMVRKIACTMMDCNISSRSVPSPEVEQKMRDIPDRIDRLIEGERLQYNILEDIFIRERKQNPPEKKP